MGRASRSRKPGECHPRWRRDGKELFYVEGGANSLMSVAVATTPSFEAETPKKLFTNPSLSGIDREYDVAADGERFVMVENVASDLSLTIHVVQNWYEEFRERDEK